MKYCICEVVRHYHEVDIDENELDIEEIVEKAKSQASRYDTGYESIESILKKYEDKYGFEYSVKPNYCGTIMEDMYVED